MSTPDDHVIPNVPRRPGRMRAWAVLALGVTSAPAVAQPADSSATSPCQKVQQANPAAHQTERERCRMESLLSRCAVGDACVVDCLANERHRERLPDGAVRLTGGGCEHICHGYDDAWQPPSGYAVCALLPADSMGGELPADERER